MRPFVNHLKAKWRKAMREEEQERAPKTPKPKAKTVKQEQSRSK